jgi:hypothetical protein
MKPFIPASIFGRELLLAYASMHGVKISRRLMASVLKCE